MAIVTTDNQHYSDIANALRAKGIGGSLMPCEMAAAIADIFSGSGAGIEDGIVVTARNSDGYATEVELYMETVPDYQFKVTTHNAYYNIAWRFLVSVTQKSSVKHIGAGAFWGCENLKSFEFSEVLTLDNGAFYSTAISGPVNLPNCVAISSNASNVSADINTFGACTGITSIQAPILGAVGRGWISGCTSLTELYLPQCTNIYTHTYSMSVGAFSGLTALHTATLGSVGYGVTRSGYTMFGNCSQSGLTITAYCKGSYADTLLSNIRNGATNATIIIKASEDTSYGGESFPAGSTIITSTVEVSE